MTAVGFSLFWVASGAALYLYEGREPIDRQSDRFMVAGIFALAGLVSVLTGISIWLWGVMP